MNIIILLIGKTKEKFIEEGFKKYEEKLKHYIPIKVNFLTEIKASNSLTIKSLKEKEGELIIKNIPKESIVYLLDELGENYNSKEFSNFIQKNLNSSIKNVVFIIGGAFGFSDEIYKTYKNKIALSKMTFTHEMCRLFLIEQIYRAFTIIKNEQYHH